MHNIPRRPITNVNGCRKIEEKMSIWSKLAITEAAIVFLVLTLSQLIADEYIKYSIFLKTIQIVGHQLLIIILCFVIYGVINMWREL